MASREIDSKIKPVVVFNIQNITSNTTSLGNIAVDTSTFESVEFLFFSTDGFVDGDYLLIVFEGDGSDPASHTQASPADFTQNSLLITQSEGANTLERIGYFGKKQFVSVKVQSVSVTTGARIGAFVILNTPRHAPTADNA